jgi:hypothetical protein
VYQVEQQAAHQGSTDHFVERGRCLKDVQGHCTGSVCAYCTPADRHAPPSVLPSS